MIICSATRTQSRRGLGCGRVGWRRAGRSGGRFRLGVGTLRVKWAVRTHAPLHQRPTRANVASRTQHLTSFDWAAATPCCRAPAPASKLRSSALRGASGQVGHQIAQPTLLPSLRGRGRWFFTVPQLSRELRCVPCLPHAALETRALGPLEQALRRRAAGRHARRSAHTCPRTAN